jgi:hypothetical protein
MMSHGVHSKKCVKFMRRGRYIVQKAARKTNKRKTKAKRHSAYVG